MVVVVWSVVGGRWWLVGTGGWWFGFEAEVPRRPSVFYCILTVIKQHQMFKGEPHRGWMKNLCFVKVTLHATAVEIAAV